MNSNTRPSQDEAFEQPPFDFGSYLARRLGTDGATATKALGEWLVRNERDETAMSEGRPRRRGQSGVFPRLDAADAGNETSNAA